MANKEEPGECCPRCGSDNTRRQRYARKPFGWALFLFGVPLPWKGRTRFCFACGRDFLPPAKRPEKQA